MSALTPQPDWPRDPDHREAVETLLLMAAAEHRWGAPRRARSLLDNAAEIIGELPEGYARLRARCQRTRPRLLERS